MTKLYMSRHLLEINNRYVYDIVLIHPNRRDLTISVATSNPGVIIDVLFGDFTNVLVLRIPEELEEAEIADMNPDNKWIVRLSELKPIYAECNDMLAGVMCFPLDRARTDFSKKELMGYTGSCENLPFVIPLFYVGDPLFKIAYINGAPHQRIITAEQQRWL